MSFQGYIYRLLAPKFQRAPLLKRFAIEADNRLGLMRHTAAAYFPRVIKPETRNLTVAITGHCNLRCIGCRYGRDFMPNAQLPWSIVRHLLDDAKEAGFATVRLYGGEPLLHPDLPRMVEHCSTLGMRAYVTTNGILLRQKVDELYSAGLRKVSIGFYGVGAAYDSYTQRQDRFAQLEASIAYVREKYARSLEVRLNWLLMRPSCSIVALHQAYQFAAKYDIPIQVDLIHYSLPYFTEGPNRMLQFRPEDRLALEQVVEELIRLKRTRPEMFNISLRGMSSIPDWLLKGPKMRVPCDKYGFIWVGADGTVQLCYVAFKLGNLYDKRLRDILFTPEHDQAARDAFSLRCPNCHCGYDTRVQRHLASRRAYAGELKR